MEEKIVEIIERLTGFKGLKQNINVDLIEEDVLDSLAFIELISSLEEEFDIEIQPTQVESDVWRSVTDIAKMVKSLQ